MDSHWQKNEDERNSSGEREIKYSFWLFFVFFIEMVKVVIGEYISGDSEWDAERSILMRLSEEKECFDYRETKAAGIPVTYVSGRRIVREVDGKRVCIGRIKGGVKVGD